ncbi:MAG: permease [Candidatus Hydrothermarchaeota archaeon]|nr:MAG: permease [Candidatus Hydrothermarchaeota archaeon]
MRAGVVFLGLSILLYLLILIINKELAVDSFFSFLKLLKKLLPVIFLVFLLIFLTNLLLEPEKISKHLGETSGIKGFALAIIGGILSTGPIYMWYPMLADLKEKGMKTSLIATFLYNRAVKIPLLPMMIYYFGIGFTFILTFYMIIFSIINGIAVEKILQKVGGEEN